VAVAWALLGAPLPGQQAAPVSAVDEATLAEGKAIYAARCATCHGTDGEGQPDWKTRKLDGTYPAPPQDASGHTWHHADGLLFRVVRDGGQAAGGPGFKTGMPAFGDTLDSEQVRAVIEYVKTFWGPSERKTQAGLSARDPYP